MTFTVNNIDFSGNVQESTYAVDQQPVYTEWTDANGKKHRNVSRQRVAGSFEMVFVEGMGKSYAAFLAALAAKTTDNALRASFSVNNANSDKTIDCYYSIEFSAVQRISDNRKYRRCTFTLEEC